LSCLFKKPIHFEFAVAIFSWLIPEIYAALGDELKDVDIEIIRVTYHGSYPALGAHYKDKMPKNVGPLIESSIDRILLEKPVIELIAAVGASKIAWRELTENIIGAGE
jgi:hypothetical protein